MSVSIPKIANLMNQSIKSSRNHIPDENRLLQYLYRSYCNLEGKDFSLYTAAVKGLCGNGYYTYRPFAQELFKWYKERYLDKFLMPKGRSGGSRTVDSQKQEKPDKKSGYRFDRLYEEHTFLKYLTAEPEITGASARDFLLHVSVAFLLPPSQVDELLSFYGFLPLHVRNIHHLAIYAVLEEMNRSGNSSENPFNDIQNLYEQACQIISGSYSERSVGENDFPMDAQMVLEKNSTRYIQNYLFGEHTLSKENMLCFVERNADIFDRRHHRLLAEHRKCTALFSKLYDTKAADDWNEEPAYNLYHFLSELCLNLGKKRSPNDIQKSGRRYQENLIGIVMKENRQPTREIMIILWIYSYCFQFMPDIAVPAAFAKLDPLKNYEKYVGNDEKYLFQHYPFQDYMDLVGESRANMNVLHVLRYLADRTDKASPLPADFVKEHAALDFDGTEMIAFINFKLQGYSWSQLNRKKPFDSVILQLRNLKVHLSSQDSISEAVYHGERVAWGQNMITGNVPIPLTFITEILLSLKTEMGGEFPLSCKLYEYI